MTGTESFVQNRSCSCFPCHSGVAPDDFNCLFCYCPLYALGKECGGNYAFTPSGVKDCSNCNIPHKSDHYMLIVERSEKIINKVRQECMDDMNEYQRGSS